MNQEFYFTFCDHEWIHFWKTASENSENRWAVDCAKCRARLFAATKKRIKELASKEKVEIK